MDMIAIFRRRCVLGGVLFQDDTLPVRGAYPLGTVKQKNILQQTFRLFFA